MDLLEELFKVNAAAIAEGRYEVAYHTLMAALHVADSRGDLIALERITQAVREQEAIVEAVRPSHNLSSTHARLRKQTPLFESLRIHIDAVRLRLESAQKLRARHS
jgi:hypothetical protein